MFLEKVTADEVPSKRFVNSNFKMHLSHNSAVFQSSYFIYTHSGQFAKYLHVVRDG